ncbi:MAG: hypothetical protein AAFN93_19960, partial [Bacteroidota bacterium]
MGFKKLFELRGTLESKDRIVLTIIGAVVLIGLWFFLAEFLSKSVITQDDSIDINKISVNDRLYYESDSLLIAQYDNLEKLSTLDLEKYGLKKNKVYPLLPSPIKVVNALPELNKNDDVIGNTFYSIKLNFLGYLVAILVSIPIGFVLGLI